MRDEDRDTPTARPAETQVTPDELRDLVFAAKQGSLAAFGRLYNNYAQRIFNYIFRLTGSREEAEDLTQDTFVLAFRSLKTLKNESKFQSWLYRIAQNSVFQRYRGKAPRVESLDQHEADETSPVARMRSLAKGPEEGVLSEELEQVVARAVGELLPKYRTVFVLSAIERLSYQEIGEIVGRSLASVKSDIHRARVVVRDRIREYLGEDYGMSRLL